jgi:hypothetical protein
MGNEVLQFRFFGIVLCCIIIAGAFIYHSASTFDPTAGGEVILIKHRERKDTTGKILPHTSASDQALQ